MGVGSMSSTVFSISLNELDMAKLGELQNKFPELSRNAMIRHIINVVHTRNTANEENMQLWIDSQQAYIKKYQDKYGVLP
jgi:hypothetical protein